MSNEGDDPIGMVTLHRFSSSAVIASNNSDEPVETIEDTFDDEDSYETIANGIDIRAYSVSHGCVQAFQNTLPQARMPSPPTVY
ncbi:hypothetical protein V1525DRAFT_387226 [Lipomyces kononenkoae]|uniref:Uncharacterized protein n=1 Tax=Lipomyces kononenkoae TaxID=34357 RepID=A0ACC3T4I5_LIPKO